MNVKVLKRIISPKILFVKIIPETARVLSHVCV